MSTTEEELKSVHAEICWHHIELSNYVIERDARVEEALSEFDDKDSQTRELLLAAFIHQERLKATALREEAACE